MAAFCSHMCIDMLVISRNFQAGFTRNCVNKGIRSLYSQAALGIDNYVKARERTNTQFINMADKFRSKMNEYSEAGSKNMIFTEDLKNIIHIVESKPEDMDLVIKMMKRFNQQNKELRFGNFVFGTVVMRMYHFQNQPEAALKAFRDPDLDGFFDQLMTFQILMDLLYENKMYQDVLDVFETVQGKQIQAAKFPKNAVVLAFAACYKLNNSESYKYAMNLWKMLQEVGHLPMRRAITFAAGLALNQNSPHSALEIIANTRQQNYITTRNIKVAALADLGRPEDALPILRNVLEVDNPDQRKQTFTVDVLQKMRSAVEKAKIGEISAEFSRLDKALAEAEHITEMTLDEHLCSEISTVIPRPQARDRTAYPGNFTRNERGFERSFEPGRSQLRQYRPGLHDLE